MTTRNTDAWTMVREFQLKQGHTLPELNQPHQLVEEVVLLRQRLILEELGELAVALHERNKVLIADACCDLAYVLHGTAVTMGLPTESNFQAIRLLYRSDLLAAVAQRCVVVVSECRNSDDWVRERIEEAVYAVARLMAFYELPFEACFREVHRSNMTKTAVAYAGGAVKYAGNPKGKGYEPPRLREVLDGRV